MHTCMSYWYGLCMKKHSDTIINILTSDFVFDVEIVLSDFDMDDCNKGLFAICAIII